MPPDDAVHIDRARASAFGAVAEDYDRFRTSYPDDLFADIIKLNPDRALDIACGTGKVAVSLLACGIAVLGLEPDPKMAEVARRHGIIVELSPFESWEDRGRRFDLLTCGQAWHWIDPDAGPRKAAEVLHPGGTLAVFWSYPTVDQHLQDDIDRAYAEHAPELSANQREDSQAQHLDALRAAHVFAAVETKTYRWSRTFTAQEWTGRTATFSDHIRLPREQLDALLAALRDAIDAHGGTVNARMRTYTIFARTPE